jgi:geranylgeranyl diphosphate synthase type II
MWSFTIARYRGTIAKTLSSRDVDVARTARGGIRLVSQARIAYLPGNDSISRFFQLMKEKAFSQELLGGYLAARAREVDAALARFLPKASTRPATIHRAMRYSLLGGGKRIRPILCLAAAEACGGHLENALPPACALECVHTYSLIHDDLPCMDNDDLRRGRPTSHKVFGEAVAVLAGDALLTQAFEILATIRETSRYRLKDFLLELASAAGSKKLIAGQVTDLEGEGKRSSRAELRFTHQCKTAAMIVASVKLGAMTADATPKELAALGKFGHSLGLAFQVIDDILDVTQTSEKLGKSPGKDEASQKATYPSIIGLQASRKEARRLTDLAHRALDPLGRKAEQLRQLADYLLAREY